METRSSLSAWLRPLAALARRRCVWGTVALALLHPCALAREVSDMSGPWDFSFDGGEVQQVTLPHSWNGKDGADGAPDGAALADSVACTSGYRRGEGVYTYKAQVRPKPGKRYFIRLEGASIVSEVLVNDQSAGKHEGAFTASCYEITDLLKPEGNTIKVKVDNSPQKEVAPLGGDFTMFGGLYRPVTLIETDALCIDPVFYASSGVQVRVMSLSEELGHVAVNVRLNGPIGQGKLAVDVLDAEGKTVAGGFKTDGFQQVDGEDGVCEATLHLMVSKPHLWQGTEDPYMYQVKVTLTTEDGQEDSVTEPLAFRAVKFDPQKGFVLNGKPMQLRGVCRHQDVDGKGWAVSPQDEERDVRLIKEMGANAVRTAHYPQSAHMYDLMDNAGFVVWTEVPCVNQVRDTAEFKANAELQAKEMIYQLGNHPCICMWGVFNEIYHQVNALGRGADMEGMLTGLNAVIKETDPSRDTVSASNQQDRTRLNRIPDHIAFNLYPGWYGGPPASMAQKLDSLLKQYGDRCLGVSEYGHGAGLVSHELPCKQPKPLSAHHPEEWQAIGHEQNYAAILARPQVWGTFVWNMFDFGSDARGEGERHGINDKGLVSYDRATRKDAFYFYKAQWNPEPMVYITSRRYTARPAGNTEVKVYSNARLVTLSVNGKEIGSIGPDSFHRAVWKDVPLAPGVNTITATADNGTSDTIQVTTPTEAHKLGTLMCIGDSITHGFGAPSYRWPLHKIFVDNGVEFTVVGVNKGNRQNSHNDKPYRGVVFNNRHSAISGERAYEISGRINNSGRLDNSNIADWLGLDKEYNGRFKLDLPAQTPDTVLILIGTNDTVCDGVRLKGVGALMPEASVNMLGALLPDGKRDGKGDMDVIISSLRQINPQVRIYVMSVPTWYEKLNNSGRVEDFAAVEQFNKEYAQWAADNGVGFININTGMVDAARTDKPFAAARGMFNAKDNLHPTPQGDLIMAANVARTLGIPGRTAGLERAALTGTTDGPARTVEIFCTVPAKDKGMWCGEVFFYVEIACCGQKGRLTLTESELSWCGTTLYSLDFSQNQEPIRITYVPDGGKTNIVPGFYVWIGDRLIGEALIGIPAGADYMKLYTAPDTKVDVKTSDKPLAPPAP